MPLTDEQLACVTFARDRKDNLMVEARAGAAKTTTLVEIAKALPGSTLAIAFNKRIVEELSARLPANCTCATLNSLGHRIWSGHIKRKLQLSPAKIFGIIKGELKSWPERDDLDESRDNIIEFVTTARRYGYVPPKLQSKYPTIITIDQLEDRLSEELSHAVRDFGNHVLARSIEEAERGSVDFDDQIYMPALARCMFPYYDTVLVDEAQDLSELNLRFLEKLVKKRVIAVGDPLQSIYGFRGAAANSMSHLRARFTMDTLYLTMTFRCAQAIAEHVLDHAPDLRFWPGNPHNPGQVDWAEQWSLSDIPDGATIICRNNAPLVSLTLAFLRSGRRPQMWGSDLTKGLVKTLNELGPHSMTSTDALEELNRWLARKGRKAKTARQSAGLVDKATCLAHFLRESTTLGQCIGMVEVILNADGKIDLLTGHKSKGFEWPLVYFLDHDLIGDDDQERNLRYVIATRAKARLVYINSSDRVA